jgi:hypothetical protein
MAIIRINELPSGSGNLTPEDLVVFMDDPNGSAITKNISVSELKEVIGLNINNSGDNRILTSDGTNDGINAESNLTFNGLRMTINCNDDNGGYFATGNSSIVNFRANQFYNGSVEPPRLIFRRTRGTESAQEIANADDGIFAVRGESINYDGDINILGGLRMEIVDPASSTSLNPSTRIFLRTSSGGENLLDKSVFLEPDGTLRNTGPIRGEYFLQQTTLDSTLNGSLTVNNGLSAPQKIHDLGTVSGNVSISYDINKQIQTLTLNGIATNFIEGTGWPLLESVDVLLEITVTSTTTVIWTLIDEQYNPFPTFTAGKYLVLLRSIGTTIQGHYIGEKTN